MPIPSLSLSALRPFVLLASVAVFLHLPFWLQPVLVLVPLALAVLLTIVLSPLVTSLRPHRLPRPVAVAVIVVAAFAVIVAAA